MPMADLRQAMDVDSVSILFLSLLRKEHTNLFRFSMELAEPVDPEALQQAVNVIWRRLPSVVACIKPDFFHYRQVPAQKPPVVRPDPGILKTMTKEELETCAFRVCYRENTISIEVFHVLTDGFGAITTLITLVSEYLRIKGGIQVPVSELRLDCTRDPQPQELEDSFLPLSKEKPWHLPSRYSYLPPRPEDTDWTVRVSTLGLPVKDLLEAAHRYGVTLNTLLASVMARSLMDQQLRRGGKLKPVRIMVPVNLRRMYGSQTLRNFALYGLPTMESNQKDWDLQQLCRSFDRQIKEHFTKENLAAMSAYNVRMQNAWFFRMLPRGLKMAAMRIGYRFFGESNSSLTFTNLGGVRLPEELASHVRDFRLYMTPRQGSPYGCTILSFGDTLTVNISKFTDDQELEDLFFGNLKALLTE